MNNFNADNMPLVSVIMAVYNGEKYLEETVCSILEQNYANIELIIIDDASTDRTPQLLRSFTDPRVTVYTNPTNRKLAYSLNFGISKASGVYIARMDADDICLPDRLTKQVEYMEAHKDVSVLGGNYRAFGNAHYRSDYKTQHEFIKVGLLFENTMCHPAILFRKSAIRDWYDESFAASQDYDLWTRLIDSHTFANLKEVVLRYRVHEGQTLKTASGAQKKGAELSRRRMLQKYGITSETYIRNFLDFCAPDNDLCAKDYLALCEGVDYVRSNAVGLDKKIFDYYAAKCSWSNVIRLKKSPDRRDILLYTLKRYPMGLFTSRRLTYLFIRSLLK